MSVTQGRDVRLSGGVVELFIKSLLFCLVALFPATALHATPILNPGERFESLKASHTAARMSTQEFSAARTTDMVRSTISNSEASQQSASYGCILASNCANPIEVPEPQSLALVGAGLLSMAGFIRRRLTI